MRVGVTKLTYWDKDGENIEVKGHKPDIREKSIFLLIKMSVLLPKVPIPHFIIIKMFDILEKTPQVCNNTLKGLFQLPGVVVCVWLSQS